MKKQDYFEVIAPYIKEDGTYEELIQTLNRHPCKDKKIIEKAAEYIGDFIIFQMDCVTKHYSKTRKKYVQSKCTPEEVIDESDYRIELWYDERILITPATNLEEVEYPHIQLFMHWNQILKRIRNKNFVNQKEQQRYEKYGAGYRYLLAKLLDGEEL